MLIRQKQSNKELTISPREWKKYEKRGDSELYTIVDWGDIVQLFERKGGQIAVSMGLFDKDHAIRMIALDGSKYYYNAIDHSQLEKAEKSRDPLDGYFPESHTEQKAEAINTLNVNHIKTANEERNNVLLTILIQRLWESTKIPFLLRKIKRITKLSQAQVNIISTTLAFITVCLAFYVAYKQGFLW